MKIHIENDIYLATDERQYIIQRHSVIKSGEKAGDDLVTNLSYYSTLEGAINALVRMKIHQSTATTLGELLEEMKRIREWISDKVAA